MPRRAVPDTLEGAATALTTKRRTVAHPIVIRPFGMLHRGPAARVVRVVAESDIVTSYGRRHSDVAGVTVERDCTKTGERSARGEQHRNLGVAEL
jgi:hypothetical protein